MNEASKKRFHRISAFVIALALIVTTIIPYSYFSGIFALMAKAETVTYILNADDLSADLVTGKTLESSVTCGTSNYFTLGASLVVDDTNKKSFTVGEKSLTITNRIKTGSTTPAKEKAISFTVSKGMEAKIEVCAVSGSSSGNTKIALYNNSDDSVVDGTLTDIAKSTTPTTTWEGISAGNYYIAVGDSAAQSANLYYVSVTEEKSTAYDVNCFIALNDTNVSTYNLTGIYKDTPITANAGKLAAALEDNASLTVAAGSGDTAASELSGSYTATVNADDKIIVVKVGDTVVANINYSVAGEVTAPKVFSYGSESSLSVSNAGQRLILKQTGGELKTSSGAIDSSVSYFGFDATSTVTEITADVTVSASGASTSNGIFFGAFDGTYIATLGIRAKTELRGIYSKSTSEMVGAGGVNTTITSGQTVSFTAKKTDSGLVITATPKGGETQIQTFPYSNGSYLLFNTDGKSQKVSYGFILANVTATIQNLKYYNASGELVYDQNDVYEAEGTAPVVSSVSAEASSTRDYITVDWTASTQPSGDGVYLLQVSTNNGTSWTDVAAGLTDTTYKYDISSAGNYLFRVCGTLGIKGTADISKAVTSNTVEVIQPLDSPVVSISSTASSVKLSWKSVTNAVNYEVYRYSYDDTADNAKKITTLTGTSYSDTNITAEMPYYYYVIAHSNDNSSNPSETVWAVASGERTGDYVYEDDAVGITMTKKSYDTVYNGKITLEGVLEKSGKVALIVNGTTVSTQQVAVRGTFAFDDIAIEQGRNDVNIEVTDKDGNVTRQTFNFVYLTNYNKVVDASYTGTDGASVNGIPTYKTVQAAVNSVSSSNSERVVILVKAGDYKEHLTVSSPNITLIGEDSTKTRIYYNSKDVKKSGSSHGQVGEDMGERCAVRIKSTATGFSAENLTFENSYEYQGKSTAGNNGNESCDALQNDADNTSYVNVRILGYQDTLCANAGTQYYYKCYITGNVDFIYGNEPRAFFNDCQIVFRYNKNKNSGYVCAPKTSASATYGLTFYNCQVLSESGCSGGAYYLARPWGADAYITWIDCYMGNIITANSANPYTDMSGNAATSARFYEYGSYGPGYAINTYRRQISKTMAEKMITASYLTWDPYTAVTNIGNKYKGTVTTNTTDTIIETEFVTDSYSTAEGDDTGLSKYSMEGYATVDKVTGGGTLKETSENYYAVKTAEEFLKALVNIKKSGNPSVIELKEDIALGSKEVSNFSSYSSIIAAHSNAPLTHPTLIKTGVSILTLDGVSNLTIFSQNGAKITHVCIDIKRSSNIIVRNITFDELWEWDDNTSGGYDRNDWDYMTIEKGSHGIWIDHCTFYKAYDGVIDIKTPDELSNITISWCSFQPASEGQTSPTSGGTFFDTMMSAMEANPSNYSYYAKLVSEGMTAEQIRGYAYGQKKTHLLGQSDSDTTAKNITATFANNYYSNSMDRMPRLRFGTAHVYNCIMDAKKLREVKLNIKNTLGSTLASKITSNGTSSNMGAHELLENCYISDITNPLISGNGDSALGYINAINSVYYLDGVQEELKPINNSSNKNLDPLVQDADEFKSEILTYSNYTLYEADKLYELVQPYTGAGVLNLTVLQWEKTAYNEEHTHTWDSGSVTKEPTCVDEGVRTYTCTSCGTTKTEAIAATNVHTYSDVWSTDKAATCTAVGSKSHHCTVCGDKKDVTEIPKIDHTWNEGEITYPVSCTVNGEITYTCKVCSTTMTEDITATGHTYSDAWTIDKAATCTEVGSKSHHCKVCGEKTDVTEIAMIDHTWDSGVVTTPATCTDDGEKTYTCTVCKTTKKEVIAAAGTQHNYGTVWLTDKAATCTEKGSKSRHCTICGDKTDVMEIDMIAHTWNIGEITTPVTCTVDGEKTYTCTVCGTTKKETITAVGYHNYGTDWIIDKAPTCTELGSKSHHCTVCGEKTDITPVDMAVHTWDEGEITYPVSCTVNGEITFKCKVCGEKMTEDILATGHTYSDAWTVDKEATTEQEGEKSHHCVKGDDRTDITVIPKLEKPTETPTESATQPTTSGATQPTSQSATSAATQKPTQSATSQSTTSAATQPTQSATSQSTTSAATQPTTSQSATSAATQPTQKPTQSAPSQSTTSAATQPTQSATSQSTTSAATQKPTQSAPSQSTTSAATQPATSQTTTQPTQEEVAVSDSEAALVEITVSYESENVPQTAFTESKAEVLNKLLTTGEKIEVKAGADVTVSMKVENVKAEDKAEESTAIQTVVASMTEQNTIGMYLDITLEKNVGNSAPVQIKENLAGKISISLEVPAEMINTDTTKTRKYSVVRYHESDNGEVSVDVLDCDFADGKITFESDKFSVYAIVYSDTAITSDNNAQTDNTGKNAPTGDSLSSVYVIGLFVLLIISAIVVFVLLRKKKL